jgi:hypothetical protein
MGDLFALDMSIHGWIALGIAVVGIIALNLGLMHLARRKHDSHYDPNRQDPDDAP